MVPTVKSTGGKKAKSYCSSCWTPCLVHLTAKERGEEIPPETTRLTSTTADAMASDERVPLAPPLTVPVHYPSPSPQPPPLPAVARLEESRARSRRSRATRTLSNCSAGVVLWCESCREWRKASGFAWHACCQDSSPRTIDRMLCFAAAQVTDNDKAWEIFASRNRIPDYVIVDAPTAMHPKLLILRSCYT